MSVRGSKRGKSSHEQKAVGSAGGLLFMSAVKGKGSGQRTVRGAAGGTMVVGTSKTKHKLKRPSFEHSVRGR